MRPALIAVALALVAASALAQPRPRPGARLPEADPVLPVFRHECAIEVGGLVRVDGKVAAWRDDFCGPITLAWRPRHCEENRALKLWRLVWSDWFWVHVRLSRESPSIERYCPQGMKTEPGAAPGALTWSATPPRADDFLLAPKRRRAAALD